MCLKFLCFSLKHTNSRHRTHLLHMTLMYVTITAWLHHTREQPRPPWGHLWITQVTQMTQRDSAPGRASKHFPLETRTCVINTGNMQLSITVSLPKVHTTKIWPKLCSGSFVSSGWAQRVKGWLGVASWKHHSHRNSSAVLHWQKGPVVIYQMWHSQRIINAEPSDCAWPRCLQVNSARLGAPKRSKEVPRAWPWELKFSYTTSLQGHVQLTVAKLRKLIF